MSAKRSSLPHDLALIQRWALTASVAGVFVCIIGVFFNPAHFFRAYLVAWNFWLGIALGSLVLLMIQYITGGAWGLLLRRVLEAAAVTLPLLALLFLPIVAGLPQLYLWTQSQTVADSPELAHKAAYLNPTAFEIRAAIYLVLWSAMALLLTRWSARQDRMGPSVDFSSRANTLSGLGLVICGVTITFASIDWIMSLEPRWFSTIFPPLYGAGQVLSGMAFAVAVVMLLSNDAPLAGIIHAQQRRDLGNLLLAFVMMWAYLSFSQFLIIWAENLPEETPWYLHRIQGGWQWTAMVLVCFQFAAPFLLLLLRDMKDNTQSLAAIALLALSMRFVDLYWWIEAAFPDGMSFYWLIDLGALAAIGGIWMWFFVWRLKQQSLLPIADPYLSEYLPEAGA